MGSCSPFACCLKQSIKPMQNNEQKLKQLTDQREQWITRIFWLGFEIALIFAVPAALGAWIGTKLGGGDLRMGILVGTFILSWVVVIHRYQQVDKKMKKLDREIKELKQATEVQDNVTEE